MSGPVTVSMAFWTGLPSGRRLHKHAGANHLQPDGIVFTGAGGQIRIGGRPSRPADQIGVFMLDTASRRVTRVSGVSVADLSAGQILASGPGVLPDGSFLKTIIDNDTFELNTEPLVSGDASLTFKAAAFSTRQHFNTH